MIHPAPLRIRVALLSLLPLLGGAVAPVSAQVDGREAARAARVTVATDADVQARLTADNGQVRVTVLYGIHCPNAQALFGELGSLTRRYSHRGVEFLAYNLDDPEDLSGVPAFLRRYRARLRPTWLEPGEPGGFREAVGSIGVELGAGFTTPLVIIQDANGDLVWSGDRVRSLPGLDEWLERAAR